MTKENDDLKKMKPTMEVIEPKFTRLTNLAVNLRKALNMIAERELENVKRLQKLNELSKSD